MSDSPKAVFLSYASQDAEAAKRLADALRTAGVEVWFDAEGGLEHGDEWDAKIRRQIKECVLFIAVISANTQAREEGYFRIEWELAAQRALGIASGVAFILPVVIDGTKEPGALVPDRFRSVQWTKLPGGNVPPDVLQRFLKLWSHRTGALKHEAGTGEPRPGDRDQGTPASSPSKSGWKAWAGLAVAIFCLAAYLIFKPPRHPEEGAKLVADTQKLATTGTPPPPVPSVRDWPRDADLKRAVKLIDDLNSIREDFLLAEEIAKKAVDKSPGDAEAVTVLAHVEASILARNFDFTSERTALARRYCERAVQLAPDDPVALAALGIFLTQRGGDNVRAEELLRRASVLAPGDSRIARDLALVISRQAGGTGTAESIRRYEEIVGRFPDDPLAHYDLSIRYRDNGRYVEAERELDATIALAPVANAFDWKARFALMRGDLPAARLWLDRVPPRLQAEERAVLTRLTYALFSGDTAYGLQSLNRFAETWFYDISNYAGPRSLLLAALREREGKPELARTLYEAALTEIHRYREEHPSDPGTQSAEAWTLLGLGRTDEARAANTVALAGLARPFRYFPPGLWWFHPFPRTLLVGDRAAALAQLREAAEQPFVRGPLRLRLQMDPRMVPFRNDPEITALLAEPKEGATAATTAASPPAADWPKDPDLKRAMKLLNSPEAIVSDVALAEDIIKGKLAERPTDVDATLAMGRVQVYYLLRGFDRSEDRFAAAKHYAERGMALAPDDPEAMMVMATYLYRRNVELPRALKLLRQAIALRPAEPLYYRLLDNVLSFMPGVTDAEIIASAKVTAERFPSDALVQYELARHYRDAGMLAEAEHYLDLAIKLGPVANAIIGRARLMLFAHGDPAGMKAILDQLPERYQGTDRAVFSRFSYAMVTGQPQLGLDGLQAMPEAWMIDFDYTGPTALLQGELLLLQGKTELARLRFAEALTELGRHKAILERNFSTTWLETWLLMRLGRLEEARRRNDVFFPELPRPFFIGLGTNWWFNPITQNLLLGEHAKALELMREAARVPQARTVLRHALRLDSRMAPYRDDPEIKALLAEPVEPSAAVAPKVDDKSVAVLAFANLSDDKANEYFSDGISEELLTVLQKIPGLHVAARTSAFSFKGKNATAQEIGEKLGVATLVEGSVRKAGNSVRITARLSRAATGEQLWSESYTRDLQDVFAVQSELAETIVGQLRGQLGGTVAKAEIQAQVQAAEKGGTRNVQAHELYLQGKYFLNHATLEDTARATGLLQRAVDLDPDFALAWAALSGAGWFRGGYGLDRHDFDEGFALARRAADRALAIEPGLVAGLIARFDLQSSLDFDWPSSRESLRRVQELAPNDPAVVFRSGQLAYSFGQLGRAEELIRQAAALDPVNPLVYTTQGYVLLALHRFDDAAAAFRRVQELSPAAPWGHAGVAMALLAAGRSEPAAAEAARETNEWSRLYALALAHWAQKNRPAADQTLAKFIAADGDVAAYQIATVYAYRGEADRAFEWLERAYRQRDPGLGWSKEDYFLQGLHADPRWPVFLKKLGVADQQLP